MVLVPVRKDDAGKPLLLILDELQVGKDELDTRIARIGEGQAKVDHQPLTAATVEIDVHANLARAAERAENQFFARNYFELRTAMSYNRLKP